MKGREEEGGRGRREGEREGGSGGSRHTNPHLLPAPMGIWFGPTTVRLTEVKIEIGKVVHCLQH